MMIKRQLTLLLVAGMMTACGSQSTPTPEPTLETPAEATEVIDVTAEVSPMSEGERLFNEFYSEAGFSCATCHYPATDERLLGPGLLSIEERFATYDVETESIEAYIRESILDPVAFIVPSDAPFPPNIMPRNYADIFTDAEIEELIVFILSH